MATGEQYFRLAINFASIAAVSRLLTPTEIGLSVIGTGIMAIALGVCEFATSDFLIQRQEVSREDIRTSFTVLFLLTALIAAVIFLLAPWLGAFYGEEKLASFLRVAAMAAVIEAIAKPITGLLRRDMAFGTLALINTTGASVTALATITLALAGFSYMSIAWATVAGSTTIAIMSFCFRPDLWTYRPALRSWRSVLTFGGYNGASHVISQTYEALPQLVLGGLLPPAAVGLYNRAMMVSQIPQRVFLASVFSVAFPALAAQIREGRSLKAPYLRALGYITVVYWPALVVVTVLAYPAVSLLLGQQWLGVVPVLQILAIAYLAWFPLILTAPVLLAAGANRDRVMVHLIARPVSALALCSAAYFGVMAMAASQLLIVPYLMLVSFHYVRRNVPFRWGELCAAIWKSAIVTATTAAGPLAVVALSDWRFDLPLAAAAGAVLLAGIGWLAGVLVTRHPVRLEFRRALDALLETLFARGWRLRDRMAAYGPRPEEAS